MFYSSQLFESFLCRKYFTCTVNATQLPLALLLAMVLGFPRGNHTSPFLVCVLLVEMDPPSPGDWSLANPGRTLRCSTVIGSQDSIRTNLTQWDFLGWGEESILFFSAGKASNNVVWAGSSKSQWVEPVDAHNTVEGRAKTEKMSLDDLFMLLAAAVLEGSPVPGLLSCTSK